MLKAEHGKKGFSLAELLAATAIVGIIAAVGIPALVSHKRDLVLTERDNYARQLFITAQNRITEMTVSGEWQQLTENTDGMPEGYFGNKMETQPSDFEYWAEASGFGISWDSEKEDMFVLSGSERSNNASLMSRIFVFGAADETLLSEGQFYIEYNRKTAAVYSVFYTSDKSEISYSYDIISQLTGIDKGGRPTDESSRSASEKIRKYHRNAENKPAVIGYYGGGISVNAETTVLSEPELEVINGECLELIITDRNSSSEKQHSEIRIEITGSDSKKTAVFRPVAVSGSDNYSATIDSDTGSNSYDIKYNLACEKTADCFVYKMILDGIAVRPEEMSADCYNLHFASQCASLCPGENIEIKIICSATDMLALPVTTAGLANSLFGSRKGDTVYISAVRHLENLSPDISGVSEDIEKAVMTSDIYWTSEKVSGQATENASGQITENTSGQITENASGQATENTSGQITENASGDKYDYSELRITDKSGAFFNYGTGSYIPVNNASLKSFDGAGHLICNFNIVQIKGNRNDCSGIFGRYGGTLSNFGVVNTTDCNEMKNVFSGLGSVGALAGLYTGSSISGCFAAVTVEGTANAGGLVGKLLPGADCVISSCYSGGMTENGRYKNESPNIAVLSKQEEVMTSATGSAAEPDTDAGSVTGSAAEFDTDAGSVTGSAAEPDTDTVTNTVTNTGSDASQNERDFCCAGGLIGYIAESRYRITIENCYASASTGSYTSEKTVYLGGLAGRSESDLSMDNSYCSAPVFAGKHDSTTDNSTMNGSTRNDSTGKDDIQVYAGAVVGFCSTEPLLKNCLYIKVFGVKGMAASNKTGTAVSYSKLSGEVNAYPYDASLGNIYPYSDVTGLGHHYGDWETVPRTYIRAVIVPSYVKKSGDETILVGKNSWNIEEALGKTLIYDSDKWTYMADGFFYYRGTADALNENDALILTFTDQENSGGIVKSYQVLYEYLQEDKDIPYTEYEAWGLYFNNGNWDCVKR